jgi:hypothetical protein
MPGLVPGIHALEEQTNKAWMAGTNKPGHDDVVGSVIKPNG